MGSEMCIRDSLGGALRDIAAVIIGDSSLSFVLSGPAAAYSAVYHLEMLILFVSLVALGPLVRRLGNEKNQPLTMKLADFPS